jgi:hypothetical protein
VAGSTSRGQSDLTAPWAACAHETSDLPVHRGQLIRMRDKYAFEHLVHEMGGIVDQLSHRSSAESDFEL